MTLFMPPIQRKKKVDEKYNPDTFRVMSEDAVSDHPKYKPFPYRASFEPRTPTPKAPGSLTSNQVSCPDQLPVDSLRPLKSTRVLPQSILDYRAHRPQAKACGFLDRNVRFLNEPICNVYTKPVQHEEAKWWPSRANPGSLVVPPYAEDTHYRADYNYRHGERPIGSGRHTAHLRREAAHGTIPVNFLRERDGSQRFYKEGLSYEHMYNCRADPNYPIRGKRQGAFVWDRMDPVSQRKFIEYHTRLDEEERRAQQTGCEGPITLLNKTGSAPVIRSANHKQNSPPPSQPLSPIKRKQSLEKASASSRKLEVPPEAKYSVDEQGNGASQPTQEQDSGQTQSDAPANADSSSKLPQSSKTPAKAEQIQEPCNAQDPADS